MRRIGLSFVVSAPPIVAGSLVAHGAAYTLGYEDRATLEHQLASTGHAYLHHLNFLLAVLVCVGLGSVLLGIREGFAGRAQRRLPAWPFALLPLIGFALQEHLERFAHDGRIPWHAATERTFALGLLLQLPFALLAYVAARVLLVGARRLGRALAARLRRARSARTWQGLRARPVSLTARISPLALGYGERGPPLPVRP